MRTQQRKRGHPNSPVRVRLPRELVEAADAEGQGNRTYGLVAMLDLARDVKENLGEHYVEVIVEAHRHRMTEGEALARLAFEGIMRKSDPGPKSYLPNSRTKEVARLVKSRTRVMLADETPSTTADDQSRNDDVLTVISSPDITLDQLREVMELSGQRIREIEQQMPAPGDNPRALRTTKVHVEKGPADQKPDGAWGPK